MEQEEEKTVIRIRDVNILSTDKKNTICCTMYEPRSPRAVLHIVHGMSEHFGRYDGFARYMAANGCVVVGSDLIGHGRTAPNPGEYGFFDDYEVLVEDQRLIVNLVRKKYRSLPYVIFGHSMGSFIVRAFIQRHGSDVDGAVIAGTAGRYKGIDFGIRLASLIAKVRGPYHVSKLLTKISLGANVKAFPGPTGFEWLTKDGSVIERYSADRMCGFPFKAAAYREMYRLIKEATEEGWAERVPQSLPVLVCSGLDDPLGNSGKGPSECFGDLEDRECSDLTIKLYPGDRHEILNETDKETVWADILEWINGVRDGKNEAAMYGMAVFPPAGGTAG
ncbi:MAG: lysophospholipase [Clostridiales bacterium]|nr:lysophospholipase [Clostridiales bacterium]